MTFKIKHYIAHNGERFSLLYGKLNDFPLFYPTAYTTRQLRSNMHNTQKEQLRAIKYLYEWAHQETLDLHQLILRHNFLRPQQIDSLAFFLKLNKKDGSTISGLKYNSTLSAIANYLRWYAAEIITDSNTPEVSNAIDKMVEAIKARQKKKVGSQTRRDQELLSKKLSLGTQMALLDLFNNPLMDIKQKAHFGPRYRNVLALRILYVTGMRVGELLSLQLQDFIIASGGEPAYLIVKRNHDDIEDDRRLQPVAKTLGRQLAIDEQLEKDISNYLIWRSQVPYVGFNDNDFLLVNHLQGRRQGRSLDEPGFRSALSVLQKKFQALSEMHPHLLRHDWNYRFSIMATKSGMSEAEERATREYCMGWKDNSLSSKRYNRRYIQEKALEIGLQIANDTTNRNRIK